MPLTRCSGTDVFEVGVEVVREVCDMKIYLVLCCKRRPGGVTPSKPHLLRSQQSARPDHHPSISASSFFSWLALARDPPAWACHPFYPALLLWSHHARGVKGLTSNFNGMVFTLSLAGLLQGRVKKIKRKKCHAKRGNRLTTLPPRWRCQGKRRGGAPRTRGGRKRGTRGAADSALQYGFSFLSPYTLFTGSSSSFSSLHSRSKRQSCQMKFPVRKSNLSPFPGENLLRGIRFSLPHNI